MDNIIKRLIECPTGNEVKNLIYETYPTWIVKSLDEYSNDYPHLTNNWRRMCNIINSEPKQIIIVNKLELTDTIMLSFAEVLSKMGFIVRKNEEYISCIVCNKALPSLSTYLTMKQHDLNIPSNWSDKCTKC